MPWQQGIAFRTTTDFRTDDNTYDYIQIAVSNNYPTVSGQGNNVGWVSGGAEGSAGGGITYSDHDDASGVASELAGAHFDTGTSVYGIELPNAGTYRIKISGGEHEYAEYIRVEVFDDTTSKGVLCDQGFAIHGCVDAQDVEHSEANWLANNSWSDNIEFASTSCRINIRGSGGGYWGMMYILVEEVETAAAQLHVNVGGVWKEAEAHVNVSGVWKPVAAVWVKVSGTWKEI